MKNENGQHPSVPTTLLKVTDAGFLCVRSRRSVSLCTYGPGGARIESAMSQRMQYALAGAPPTPHERSGRRLAFCASPTGRITVLLVCGNCPEVVRISQCRSMFTQGRARSNALEKNASMFPESTKTLVAMFGPFWASPVRHRRIADKNPG